VVSAVAVEDVGAGLRLVFLDPALDQVPAGFRPMDPVGRGRHADLVDGLGPPVHDLPLPARDVPQIPGVAEKADLGAAQYEGLIGCIGQHRAVAGPGECPALVPARRKSYRDIDRYGFAPGPTAVLGAHLAAASGDLCGMRA